MREFFANLIAFIFMGVSVFCLAVGVYLCIYAASIGNIEYVAFSLWTPILAFGFLWLGNGIVDWIEGDEDEQ
jgi:hypothetical protein